MYCIKKIDPNHNESTEFEFNTAKELFKFLTDNNNDDGSDLFWGRGFNVYRGDEKIGHSDHVKILFMKTKQNWEGKEIKVAPSIEGLMELSSLD